MIQPLFTKRSSRDFLVCNKCEALPEEKGRRHVPELLESHPVGEPDSQQAVAMEFEWRCASRGADHKALLGFSMLQRETIPDPCPLPACLSLQPP